MDAKQATSSSQIPTVITRDLPNAVVYDLSKSGSVRITLPRGSTWSSGLHWHESHDEYLQVVKGSIRARLGDSWTTLTATDSHQPEVKVARYVWHEWRRAGADGEDVVVVERTEPSDGEKHLFFWNLNGVILSAPKLLADPASVVSRSPPAFRRVLLDAWITLNLFIIFYHLDNFPVFLELPKPLAGLDWLVTHATLYLASWVGYIFGVLPVKREHTPPEAHHAWSRKNRRTR